MTRRDAFRLAFGSILLTWALPDSVRAQGAAAAAAPASLAIVGDVTRPLSFTPAELKALPRTKVEIKTEDGVVNVYEGVLAGELLKLAGVPLGGQMRGNMVASYVLAS